MVQIIKFSNYLDPELDFKTFDTVTDFEDYATDPNYDNDALGEDHADYLRPFCCGIHVLQEQLGGSYQVQLRYSDDDYSRRLSIDDIPSTRYDIIDEYSKYNIVLHSLINSLEFLMKIPMKNITEAVIITFQI